MSSSQVVVHIDSAPRRDGVIELLRADPCALGHAWAWMYVAGGGQVVRCYRCGRAG